MSEEGTSDALRRIGPIKSNYYGNMITRNTISKFLCVCVCVCVCICCMGVYMCIGDNTKIGTAEVEWG